MKKKIIVSRSITLPDLLRIRLYEKSPEFGPRILFFSGGTALNETSRVLKKFTHNSIHFVTPFDSGGSSAVLRKAFGIPAIGDLRSRLMALADDTISGHPEIFQLFAYRLSKTAKRRELLTQLKNMIEGKDPLISTIKTPMRKLICNHLSLFLERMPEKFDLKGASIGNLILTAGYLNNKHHLDPVIFLFSKLVNALGHVAPIVDDSLHLAVTLENGKQIYGQHLITGKEAQPLKSPIKDLYLIKNLKNNKPATTHISNKKRKEIINADLICYPPGSFYSSIAANLLAGGVGQAIANNPCPKVYMPNLGVDPESIGMNLEQSVFKLLEILRRDTGDACPANKLLNFIFIDSDNGLKMDNSSKRKLRNAGIEILDTRLISKPGKTEYDPQLLVMNLLSLT